MVSERGEARTRGGGEQGAWWRQRRTPYAPGRLEKRGEALGEHCHGQEGAEAESVSRGAIGLGILVRRRLHNRLCRVDAPGGHIAGGLHLATGLEVALAGAVVPVVAGDIVAAPHIVVV